MRPRVVSLREERRTAASHRIIRASSSSSSSSPLASLVRPGLSWTHLGHLVRHLRAAHTRARARERAHGRGRSTTIARDVSQPPSRASFLPLFLPRAFSGEHLARRGGRDDSLAPPSSSVSLSLSRCATNSRNSERDRRSRLTRAFHAARILLAVSRQPAIRSPPSTPIATCSEIDARHPRPRDDVTFAYSRFTSVRWPWRHPTARSLGRAAG